MELLGNLLHHLFDMPHHAISSLTDNAKHHDQPHR